MAHDDGRRSPKHPRATRLACHLWLIALFAAPVDPLRLELLPHEWPNERRELIARLTPLLADEGAVRGALKEEGVEVVVIHHLLSTPPGPLLTERCAHALALAASALESKPRALLTQLTRAVEAAQLALDVRRRSVGADLQLVDDDPSSRAARELFEREIRAIEVRYWRIAGLVLDRDQRIELRKRLPLAHRQVPDLPGHIRLLVGLSASQAVRVQALTAEFASESAVDGAELQRLRQADPPDQARINAVTDRIVERLRALLERGRALFTPEQAAELDALSPLVSPSDRKRNPAEIVAKLSLTAEQRALLGGLGGQIAARIEEAKARAAARRAEFEGEIGPEAPQSKMMEMASAGEEAAMVAAYEEAARVAMLDVLEPAQVAEWVVSGS